MNNIKNPLDNLNYYLEWGGKSWANLFSYSLKSFIGYNLNGQHILEIGPRYGKISCLFALLGGRVTGLDMKEAFISVANDEAKKYGVQELTNFICYDGNLNILKNEEYDLIFTKSVLVVIPNLEEYLVELNDKLKAEGKIVFLENASSNRVIHALRYLKHYRHGLKRFSFFSEKEILLIKKIFNVKIVRKSIFPPVYLVCGYKKNDKSKGSRKIDG